MMILTALLSYLGTYSFLHVYADTELERQVHIAVTHPSPSGSFVNRKGWDAVHR